MISQISDINSEEESFHSNPSFSSLNSTITSNIHTRRTAATATAAAYTKKLVPMSRAWVSGRESLSASKLSKTTSSLDTSNFYDEIRRFECCPNNIGSLRVPMEGFIFRDDKPATYQKILPSGKKESSAAKGCI